MGSLLGGFWSILNPIFQLTLYTLVFSLFLKQKFSQGGSDIHYAFYVFAALLPWLAFQETISRSTRSFIDHAPIIQKNRFPLGVLPFSIMAASFLHQCVGTLLLVGLLALGGQLSFSTLPLWLLACTLQLLLSYGLSLLLANLNVYLRDIGQGLSVLFLALFWTTPIVYPRHRAGSLGWILDLNPLTHMVELHRLALFGESSVTPTGVAYWAICCLVACWAGLVVAAKTRATIADLV